MLAAPNPVFPTSRILVVEESSHAAEVLIGWLESAGACHVAPVASLKAALRVLTRERICAVLFAADLGNGQGAAQLDASLEARQIPSLLINWVPIVIKVRLQATRKQLSWPFSETALIAAVSPLLTNLPRHLIGL
jgi:CheY-like chemotaxis protein